MVTSSSIFAHTYGSSQTGPAIPPNTWHPYPNDDFRGRVLTPAFGDPNHILPVKLTLGIGRTALYLATRVCEMVAHTLVAMNVLLQHLNQHVQSLFKEGVTDTGMLHSVVTAAADDSVRHHETFFSHAGTHLARKARTDYTTCRQLFKSHAPFKEKMGGLVAKVVDWTFIVPQMLLMQGASTACETAGTLLEVEDQIVPDIEATKAYLDTLYKQQRASHAPSSTYYPSISQTNEPGPTTRWGWDGVFGFSRLVSGRVATPITELPTFTVGEGDQIVVNSTEGSTIHYDRISSSEDELCTWMQGARAFILANQDKMHPVGLGGGSNLCFYNTYFQVVVHNLLMQGEFLGEDEISQAIWQSIFTDGGLDHFPEETRLRPFRDDMVRYLHALVKGITEQKSQSTCLDGHLPNIRFGSQQDLLQASATFNTAHGAPFAGRTKTDKAHPRTLPLSACIQPERTGRHRVQYVQVPFEQWFLCDRKTLFIEQHGFDLLKAWLNTQPAGSNITINYYSKRTNTTTHLSVRDGDLTTLLDLIAIDKVAGLYAGDNSVTFTLTDITPPDALAVREEEQAVHFEDMAIPALHHPDLTFPQAVALALTGSYTNPDRIIWENDSRDTFHTAQTLLELSNWFMARELPTVEDCFTNTWERTYPETLLMRVNCTAVNQAGSLVVNEPSARVKPELHFDLDGRSWNLTAFSYHLGKAGGGHWIAYRKNPEGQWYKLNDSSTTLVTGGDTAIEALIKHQTLETQVADVIYQIDTTDGSADGGDGE